MTAVEVPLLVLGAHPIFEKCIPRVIFSPLLAIASRLYMTAPFTLGTYAMCAGSIIRTMAVRRLRERFPCGTALCLDHTLETGGIYSVVRHPAYAGSMIFIAGAYVCLHDGGSLLAALGLWESVWGSVVDIIVFVAGLVAAYCLRDRIRVEERVLQAQFGEEWVAWRGKIDKRLIPFVF